MMNSCINSCINIEFLYRSKIFQVRLSAKFWLMSFGLSALFPKTDTSPWSSAQVKSCCVHPVFQTLFSIITKNKLTMLSQHVHVQIQQILPCRSSGGASDIDCSSVWVTVSVERPSPACLPCCHSFSACPWSTTTSSVCFRWDSAAHSQGSAAALQAVWGCLSANAMLGGVLQE